MELKDFIQQVLVENNIVGDVKEIEKLITDIARERAVDGCCAISDDEIREMVINNAELSNKLVQEKKQKELAKEQEEKLKEEQKKAVALEKKIEKERKINETTEQQSLF